METIEISLLDNDLYKDKIYKYKDLSLVNLYRDSLRFKEFNNSAFYILLGPDEPYRQIYVGLSTNIGRRLYEHKRAKSFWTEAIFFILNDGNFTKTDIAYLEQYFIKHLIDFNYFQNMTNYLIPLDSHIYSLDEPRLNNYIEMINLLISVNGCLRMHEKVDSQYSKNVSTGKQMIDRVAKSYMAYAEGNDDLYYCNDYMEEDKHYMELGSGKVIIFKGTELKGYIPKKYKEKIENNILIEEIVVDNLIRAKEMIGTND